MVGQMHSGLGILRVYLAKERNVYSLKEDYLNIVKMVLTPFSSWDSISGTVGNHKVNLYEIKPMVRIGQSRLIILTKSLLLVSGIIDWL
jgi:hypothetical protein